MSQCERRGDSLFAQVEIAASPEKVWACLSENQEIACWFPDTAEGRVEVGEVLTWDFEDFHTTDYRVLEVTPGRRLVLEPELPWEWEARMIFELEPLAEGCRLHLEQSGMPPATPEWEDALEGMTSGWVLAFRGLKQYLEHHHGAPRRHMKAFVEADFDWEALPPYFREPDRLAAWLTTSGEVAGAGAPVALELKEGGRVSGEVLARTNREVMVSWREVDGLLQLKAFGFGPDSRQVGLDAWGYGLSEEDAARHKAWMEAAAQRLAEVLKAG